jgi:DNA-binding CsgD family transcriptional regulator/tetratricopeptide (TPR) repeat protein
MIGRERELEELGKILFRTGKGEGGLLLLVGEAGVGKTRLAEAAIAAEPLDCLRGVAAERGAPPYAPLAAVLRQYLHRDPAALLGPQPLVAHLHALLPELGQAPSATDRETLFEALRRAFETISARQATVVFLDDLQWADAATLELLPSLAEAAEEWPLLVLGAYRSEEIPRGHPLRRLRTDLRRAGRLAELSVDPLDEEATTRIAARVLGVEPGPTLRAALYDRTQGVPFFVEEFAAALRDGARLTPRTCGLELEEGSTVPIPETLRDALRVRAEGLSDEGRDALEAAAVVGVEIELELLAALSRDASLSEVLDRGLLQEVEPGIAAFRHDLVREAVYADTHWPRRRSLHRELANLLENRDTEPRLIAKHWLAAGERGRALPLLIEAARRSCAVHAYRDAAAAGRAALEIWPEGEDEPGRLDVLAQLARCAQLCGELAEASRAWEEVADGLNEAADHQRLAEVQRQLATVYELQGASAKATAARLEAADAFDTLGLDADAAVEFLAAAEGLWSEDEAQVERLLDRALETARRAGSSDVESRCLSNKGFIAGREGRRDEALELLRSALALAVDGNHVEAAVAAYWALGATANAWSDHATAQTAFDDALLYCRANHLSDDEQLCIGCLAVVLQNSGEWTRAEQLARALLQRSSLHKWNAAHAVMTLGLIATARGATKRGRRLLTRARGITGEIGMLESTHECELGLALVDELEDVASPRWHELVTAHVEYMSLSHARGLRLASTFAARRDETGLVYACADASASWTSRFANADTLAALAHVLGEVALVEGDAASAADQFGYALERLAEIEAPFERALTQARAGTALIAADERELGVERLTSAYRTFRKLGARPFANRAAADLAAAGERVDERLGRRAARDVEQRGLTRRELEILRLVAVGRTNREIAHHLFLSPRTVDMHVRNMLTKLGCRSRTEATGRAHDLGLLEPLTSGRARNEADR